MAGGFWLSPLPGLLALVVYLFAVGLQYLWYRKQHQKTHYELTDEKIRVTEGTYFSDSETELLWSKVVQTGLTQGVLQRILFGTGNLYLQAAGQAETEARLLEIDRMSMTFRDILIRLDEDVTLPQDTLKEEHRPSATGLLIDAMLPTILIPLAVLGLAAAGLQFVSVPVPYLDLGVSITVLLIVLANRLYVFLRESNTTYECYERHVVVEVNFLGLNRSVLPLALLSDVNLYQTVLKRPFGLSHLLLSVPGVGDTLKLYNLTRGEAVRETLLKRSSKLKAASSDQKRPNPDRRFEAEPDFAATMARPLGLLVVWLGLTAGAGVLLYQNPNLSGTVRLGAAGGVVVAFVGALLYCLLRYISWRSASFAVQDNRAEYTYVFVKKSITSLSTDKIKAIEKSQGILQRYFNTYTVTFHSVGIDRDLSFFNLPDTAGTREMIRTIRQREGSYGGDKLTSVQPAFSMTGMLFQNPLSVIAPPVLFLVPGVLLGILLFEAVDMIALAGLIGLVVSLVVLGLLYSYRWFYYQHYVSLDLYPGYLTYRDGFFHTRQFHVRYGDVRNVEYARQPTGSTGWLRVDFAGGMTRPDQKRSNFEKLFRSRGGFRFKHLANVEAAAPALEEIFAGETEPSRLKARTTEYMQRPDEVARYTTAPQRLPYLGQGLLYGFFVALFLADVDPALLTSLYTPALMGAGGVLGLVYHRSITYTIRDNQVESNHWVLLTRTKSVKYQNVDNIEADRNLLDKILGTGTVKVSTTGGSGVEMKARFLSDYTSFYEKLQNEYNEATTNESTGS